MKRQDKFPGNARNRYFSVFSNKSRIKGQPSLPSRTCFNPRPTGLPGLQTTLMEAIEAFSRLYSSCSARREHMLKPSEPQKRMRKGSCTLRVEYLRNVVYTQLRLANRRWKLCPLSIIDITSPGWVGWSEEPGGAAYHKAERRALGFLGADRGNARSCL